MKIRLTKHTELLAVTPGGATFEVVAVIAPGATTCTNTTCTTCATTVVGAKSLNH